jgi:hypothetical protein
MKDMDAYVVTLSMPGREEWTLHGFFRSAGQAKYEAWIVFHHGGYSRLHGYPSKRVFMSYAKAEPQ